MPPDSDPTSLPESRESPGTQAHGSDEEAPPREVIAYGSGAVPNELIGSTFNNLIHPILNMTLGVSPAIVGLLLSFRGIWDAFTDPVMAYISDNTKSRWGRRRPYIFVGGLTMLVLGSLAWFIPRGLSEMGIAWYFGVMMVLFATSQTVYSVPYWAQGIELSPTYHGRTRVALVRTLFHRVFAFSGPWLLPFCTLAIFADAAQGVRWLVVVLTVVSVPCLLFSVFTTRERTKVVEQKRESFYRAVKCMVTNIHFLRVTAIYAILLFVFGVFGAFQTYLTVYYVCGGDLQKGAFLQGWGGTLGAIVGIACIPVMGWLSRRIQKHHAVNIAVLIMFNGTAATWWLYDPEHPWLTIVDMGIYQFGVSAIFTLIPSLHADVVDFDEYKTGRRREGMLGAAAAYLMKTAQAIGSGISGFVIAWTGFDAAKGGDQGADTFLALRLVYIVGASLPLFLVMLILVRYPLTEKEVDHVQAELKKRKQKLGLSVAAPDATSE